MAGGLEKNTPDEEIDAVEVLAENQGKKVEKENAKEG